MMESVFTPEALRTLISIALFSIASAELVLLIFKCSNNAPFKSYIYSAAAMATNVIALLLSMQNQGIFSFDFSKVHLQWIIYVVLISLSLLHLLLAFPRENRRAKNSLSPNSIREAVDNLQMGLCFANPIDRIVLINKKMQKLTGELFGFCPQMMSEFKEALNSPKNGTVLSNGCIKTWAGDIYRFRTYEHTVDEKPGWIQVTAYDVTERYAVGRQLRLENEKLKIVNKKLRKMYERMSDDIRERESLELKIYLHDTIGRSILTVQDIMRSNEETRQKVRALQEAVSVLSGNRTSFAGTMDEVKRNAGKMGVNIKVEGYIPADTAIESIAVSAIRECVTNCVKHAKGNRILVTAQELGDVFRISISNNGEKPKGKITEGGGLSSLRRQVESKGGEMTISHYPAFLLVLNLPRKDPEEW